VRQLPGLIGVNPDSLPQEPRLRRRDDPIWAARLPVAVFRPARFGSGSQPGPFHVRERHRFCRGKRGSALMEPVTILDVLRRRMVLIIAVCLITAIAGYAFSFLLPTKYSATTVLLVRPQQPIKTGAEKENREFLNFPIGGASAVETASRTYIELIKSPTLIGEVVQQLKLDQEKDDDETGGGLLSRLLPAGIEPAALKRSLQELMSIIKYGSVIDDDPFTKAIKTISGGLTLEAVLDTYTFQIKYTSKDPDQAAAVANATARTLIKFVDDLRLSEGRRQSDSLRAELDQAREKMDAARLRLENYKKTHSVFLYESEYTAKLRVLGDLRVELAKAEAALGGSQNTLASGGLAERRARLMRSIAEREAELIPLPRIERELKELEQELNHAIAVYEIVEKQFMQVDLNQSYMMPEVRLVSEAAASKLPSSPRRGMLTAASLVGGIVVAIGLALLLEYLNRKIRSVRDIEEFVGIKVLATVPRISWRRWRRAGLV
jgi:uncharacterized protein involved in exopolysaccharide biosynthesis